MTTEVGRLAPTPSGSLHLGNVVAFTACWLSARSVGGRVLLRVEDVDRSRSRRHLEDAQKRELEWLGLTWDEETPPQRDRDYSPWLEALDSTYFCTCTRKTIALGGGQHPIACRTRRSTAGAVRFALRDREIRFRDRVHGARCVCPLDFGDPVLRRRDGMFTYVLAVVADDIADGVTQVVRGADLLDYTGVQMALWDALGATPPTWMHTPLVLGPDGRKLSKSHADVGVGEMRDQGRSAESIIAYALSVLGQVAQTLDEAVHTFDPRAIPTEPVTIS